MPTEETKAEIERQLLADAAALIDLRKTEGWKVVDGRIQAALDAIDRQLKSLPLADNRGTRFTAEQVGSQYLQLMDRRDGILAIRAEIENTIRRAEKILERQNPA